MSIEKTKLVATFKENEINGESLKEMDEETLILIGVKLPADRRVLLHKIPQLFKQSKPNIS